MMDLLAFVHSGYFFSEIAIGIPSLSLVIREQVFCSGADYVKVLL